MVSRDQEEASITKFSDEFRIQAGFKQPVVIDFGANTSRMDESNFEKWPIFWKVKFNIL